VSHRAYRWLRGEQHQLAIKDTYVVVGDDVPQL
jgi:hypothetical protein